MLPVSLFYLDKETRCWINNNIENSCWNKHLVQIGELQHSHSSKSGETPVL